MSPGVPSELQMICPCKLQVRWLKGFVNVPVRSFSGDVEISIGWLGQVAFRHTELMAREKQAGIPVTRAIKIGTMLIHSRRHQAHCLGK